MENVTEYPENENEKTQSTPQETPDQDEAEFENPSVDPGFGTEDELTGQEDEREGDIDANKSISEMDKESDALNYKNDRENGAYNPKNI